MLRWRLNYRIMLLFGHTGITLGVATALANLPACQSLARKLPRPHFTSRAEPPKPSLFDSLADLVDIRVLLIGSLLPDIIDKPLGHLFFAQSLSNGRIYAHTILFLILISALGGYLYRRSRRTWMLALSFGTATHLILDQMWQNPHTLLWPLLGFAFEKTDLSDWIPQMLRALVTSPADYIPESIGLVLTGWLAYVVIRRRRTRAFMRHGSIR